MSSIKNGKMAQAARIYYERIQFHLFVPEGTEWDFMREFANAFRHTITGAKRSVDNYSQATDGWHITLTVKSDEKEKFYDFCKNFFLARKIGIQK
ncbi:MAG: hypothetical protein WCK48_01305 [bacterium]